MGPPIEAQVPYRATLLPPTGHTHGWSYLQPITENIFMDVTDTRKSKSMANVKWELGIWTYNGVRWKAYG